MIKTNKNINYESSFNKAFRNPALIHRIQDKLQSADLTEINSLTMAIVAYRGASIVPLIHILAKEDRAAVVKIIGNQTMIDIDEYMHGESEPATPKAPEGYPEAPTLLLYDALHWGNDDVPNEIFPHRNDLHNPSNIHP